MPPRKTLVNKFSGTLARELLHDLRRRQGAMVQLLGRLVRAESPTGDKAAMDRFARMLAAEWRRRGARLELLRERQAGDHLRVELNFGGRLRRQILVLGHMDTVYELGTLARMPFHVAGGHACGPGAFDMKSGLVQALFAADALRRAGVRPAKRAVFLFTSDEETGSHTSRKIIEREARRSAATLVLEPASGSDGRLKTARKGVGEVEVLVTGRAAHAGLNPGAGVNAVHELALQIERIQGFREPRRGIGVNVGVIAGGTRSNVIPEKARALVDVRVARAEDARRLKRKFQALRPFLPGARLEIHGGINRPPLERTAAVARLFRHAGRLAGEMGFRLKEATVGGGSDGNFTAALGVPTLDGLGGVGNGAHSAKEFAVIGAMPQRAALLAALLATL